MTIHLLFYHEVSRYERTFNWVHKHAGMYGFVPLVIDPSGKWPTERPDLPQLVYRSLADVVAGVERFAGHTFVWLDNKAVQSIDSFEHPQDDVVYCVGSDVNGFGGFEWEGPRVRVLDSGDEMFANIIVPIVCYDRWLYLNGRRA